MIKGMESILLSSQNSTKLANFYKEKIGLKITAEMEVGEKGEMGYEIGMKQGSGFYIMQHSKVNGKNNNPERFMTNFEVDDIEKEVKRIKKAKVKVIKDIYHMQGYGLITTLEDIDGNYFQLVQIKAN
jgi:predicted enzyme related to lactoylglutathione lyase